MSANLDELELDLAADVREQARAAAEHHRRDRERESLDEVPHPRAGWRGNGCFVGFWFRFTPANLASLAREIWRKR